MGSACAHVLETRAWHPKKRLLFERCFRTKTLRTAFLCLCCTKRQTCYKYQCCGIFAEGISACDRVSCSTMCCTEKQKCCIYQCLGHCHQGHERLRPPCSRNVKHPWQKRCKYRCFGQHRHIDGRNYHPPPLPQTPETP